MTTFKKIGQETSQAGQEPRLLLTVLKSGNWKQNRWQKLRGGLLLAVGYLLSPLSWWNDLFFNLPIAYGFGYLCSWFSPHLLLSASIVGYWFSNILGILLMQVGAVSIVQEAPQERNLKQALLTGFLSSTAYTLIILVLVQFKVLDTPALFAGETQNYLGSFLKGLVP
jgi:hypothetical protein